MSRSGASSWTASARSSAVRVEGGASATILPRVDDYDPIRVGLRLCSVVGGEDDRHAAAAEAVDQIPDRVGRIGVQSQGRFVEEEQVGVVQEGAGEIETAAQAAGEGAAEVVGAVVEVGRLQQFVDPRRALAAGQIEKLSVQLESFAHGHQIVAAGLLEDLSDSPPQAVAVNVVEEADAAALGNQFAADQLEQGRFAGPVGAQQGGGATVFQSEIDLVDAAPAVVLERDGVQLDGRSGRAGAVRSSHRASVSGGWARSVR